MKKRGLILALLMLFSLAALLQAQDISPTGSDIDPALNISFPPPVYVLSGTVEVRGSVNLAGMSNYFIEFRPLVFPAEGETISEDRPWFPATLPANQAVIDGLLGRWDTLTAPDGLYELRLTVNTNAGAQFFRVSPLRVENTPSPFAVTATPTPFVQLRPTLMPSPTPLDRSPRVTALVDANLRRGDDVTYERIGSLLRGESATVIGVSSFGTGWYYIELPNGLRGFIAPSVVEPSGDIRSLPLIDPPPPPTPLATATPIVTANLHFTQLFTQPSPPVCNQTFTIFVDVQNNGTAPTISSGTISVVDRHVASGTVAQTTVGGFPILQPGQTFTGIIPLTVSTFFDEQHSLTIVIDSLGEIPESNEGDNTSSLTYTLQRGGC